MLPQLNNTHTIQYYLFSIHYKKMKSARFFPINIQLKSSICTHTHTHILAQKLTKNSELGKCVFFVLAKGSRILHVINMVCSPQRFCSYFRCLAREKWKKTRQQSAAITNKLFAETNYCLRTGITYT